MKSSHLLAPLAAFLLMPLAAPTPAAAQLLGDQVIGDQRVCIYAGSDEVVDGQSVPRSTAVPASQPCPTTPPFRNPNQRPPGNAALLRDQVAGGQRVCVYTQGGVNYYRAIPQNRYCSATPDLLDRLVTRDPAAPFRR